MKRIAVCVAGALLGALALSGCAKKAEKGDFTLENGKFKVGVCVDLPPFEYYAADGKTAIGFDIELGKEIAKRLGLSAEFIDTDWDGLFAGLDAHRYDLIISGMTITDERKANYAFSMPYIGNGQAILLEKSSELDITQPEDLKGHKVGYQAQSTSDFFMQKLENENGVTHIHAEYDKAFNAFDDLKFKRIEAVVSDYLVAADYLSKTNTEYKLVWKGDSDEYMGICMKKDNAVLLEKVNGALDAMKAGGTLKKLYTDAFGMDLSDSISGAQ
ncbi:MAG: transporter substrate-binding domain-containing protein [Treponema sp.]